MTDGLYLKHHGIAGQKWGKQNGPPYPLDKSNYSSSEKKANKISEKNRQLSTKEKYKRMSDDELKRKVERMRLEKNAIDLDMQLNPVPKAKKSVAMEFIKNFASKTGEGLSNASKTIVQQYVEKELRKRLGLNTPKSELEKLKEEYTKLNYEKLIKNLKTDLNK